MKTIEERAKEYAPDAFDPDYILPAREGYIVNRQRNAYIAGATEQKDIDDEVIKKLNSIVEHSASVLGIGTKWFNEDARQVAIEELRQEILNYLSD